VARVVGLGASVLFDKQNPLNPINRRISIIVMTKRAEEAALKNDVPQVVPPTTTADAAQGPSGTASVSASAGNAALPATPIATTVAAAAAAADAAQRLRRSGANNQATARVGDLAIPLQGSAAGPSDSAARSTALRP
jgi:chemotaxis protein MotB